MVNIFTRLVKMVESLAERERTDGKASQRKSVAARLRIPCGQAACRNVESTLSDAGLAHTQQPEQSLHSYIASLRACSQARI